MNRRKSLCFFLICAVLGAAAAVGSVYLQERLSGPKIEKWRLETPVVYSKELQDKVMEMQTEKQTCVLWRKKKFVCVENMELGRQVIIDAYGIAGSSSVLFPNANVLHTDDTGTCLLSSDVAWNLFGGTDIAGRNVSVDGVEYTVAGVVFQEEQLCVFELDPEKEQKLTHAAVYCERSEENQLQKQRMNAALQQDSL